MKKWKTWFWHCFTKVAISPLIMVRFEKFKNWLVAGNKPILQDGLNLLFAHPYPFYLSPTGGRALFQTLSFWLRMCMWYQKLLLNPLHIIAPLYNLSLFSRTFLHIQWYVSFISSDPLMDAQSCQWRNNSTGKKERVNCLTHENVQSGHTYCCESSQGNPYCCGRNM